MGRVIGALLAGILILALLYYAAIIVFIIAAVYAIVRGGYHIFLSIYFSSEKFSKLKASIENNIQDCNNLNLHIEELKHSYNKYYRHQLDAGVSTFVDRSSWNYQRPELNKYSDTNNTYNCSRQVCSNARIQPFKYICKYFNIVCDEKSLAFYEDLTNKFAAVEQGKESYIAERDALMASIQTEVPSLIIQFSKQRLYNELGIRPFKFYDQYYPSYKFLYISSGGNSSLECVVDFDVSTLEKFTRYIVSVIEKKESIIYQRQLMTTKLREQIKQRDGYKCVCCGTSLKEEPHLLLEIDHIIPVSKGGKTVPENLQTLCWRCNRSKSNKMDYLSENNSSDLSGNSYSRLD